MYSLFNRYYILCSDGTQYIPKGASICGILWNPQPPYYTLVLLTAADGNQLLSQTTLTAEFQMTVCFFFLSFMFLYLLHITIVFICNISF